MEFCPAAILASAQAAATGGLYGYTEVPENMFVPYLGSEQDEIDGRCGIYLLGPDQQFEFNDAQKMYRPEGRPDPEVTAAGSIVYVLHYGHGGYLPNEDDGRGFWRVSGVKTDDGKCFLLSET